MKPLTIKQLKKFLDKFDENLPVVITDAGSNDHYAVVKEDIKILDYCYFANDDADEPEGEVLQIAITE